MLAAQTLALPKISYWAIAPEAILIGGALLMLAMSATIRSKIDPVIFSIITFVTSLASIGAGVILYINVLKHGKYLAIDGALSVDGFGIIVGMAVGVAIAIFALSSEGFLSREGWDGPELLALGLLSGTGAELMAMANDLIMIFLALEILSIALYVLAGMDGRRTASGEAAIKYLILGGFSSAIFVYGIAFVYGTTGSTNLAQIAAFFATNLLAHDGLFLVGMTLVLIGFAFKVAAVPFHVWSPDVYQGAPTPATSFMASVAKLGAFAALLRVFLSAFISYKQDWQPLVFGVAIATLLLGAFGGLVQNNVKRMLAYSSISHAGFILLGLVVGAELGAQRVVLYLIAYTFIVMGAFSVITVVGGKGDNGHDISNYRGLARQHPYLSGSLALFLMAQAGVPFTVGFVAKFGVLSALASSGGVGSYTLVVVALVSSVISAFYYLRIVVVTYSSPVGIGAIEPEPLAESTHVASELESFNVDELSMEYSPLKVAVDYDIEEIERALDESPLEDPIGKVPLSSTIAISISATATVVLGVFPGILFALVSHATFLF